MDATTPGIDPLPASGTSSQPSYICDLCGAKVSTKSALTNHRGSGKCTKNIVLQQRNPTATSATIPSPASPTDTNLLDTVKSLRAGLSLAKRIPKGVRRIVAESFRSAVDRCIAENTVETWRHLGLFSLVVFRLPGSSKTDREESISSIIKRNLALYQSPEYDFRNPESRRVRPPATEETIGKVARSKIQEGDLRGAVRVLCSDDAVASFTEDVLEELREKHPPGKANAIYPTTLPPSLRRIPKVTGKEVYDAICSFPNGSAGGVDGLRPQHLKDMLGGQSESFCEDFCSALASLIDMMLDGKVPSLVCPFLYGATLTALNKKGGGIRPIAVGNVIRRVAAKLVVNRVQDTVGELLRPTQLGFGTKGGTETIVHAVRRFLSHPEETTKVLLKLDFKNAFNTLFRDRMLTAVNDKIPEYLPFLSQAYEKPSWLLFGKHLLLSQSGIQQGDPLGPLMFCLATLPLVTSVSSSVNAWYLDDGTLCGDPKDVLADLQTISQTASEYGLQLNMAKCELFVFGGTQETQRGVGEMFVHYAPEIALPSMEELFLLGSPLLQDATPSAIDKRTEEMQRLSSRLKLLPAHQALFVLRNCLSVPKMVYLLRSSSVWECQRKLEQFDNCTRLALQQITNVRITEERWERASLPVSKGGLGLRKTAELALPAFLASVHAVSSLVSTIVSLPDDGVLERAETNWSEKTVCPLPPTNLRAVQKVWDSAVAQQQFEKVISSLQNDPVQKARALAVSQPESGKWLNALPSSNLGTLLSDAHLRIAVALRIGAPVCMPHKCHSGKQVQEDGHHGLHCIKSAGRWSRHENLNDLVRRSLSTAGIPSRLEPSGTDRRIGVRTRPDGMTLVPYRRGQPAAWDVTVVDTVATSYIAKTCIRAGAAAEEAENDKRSKYEHLADDFDFVPLGFETFGSLGPACKLFLKDLGRRMSAVTGERRSSEFLFQRVSVEIQRGNALSVLGTIPSSEGLGAIFLLL